MKDDIGPISKFDKAEEIRRIADQLVKLSSENPDSRPKEVQQDVLLNFVNGVIRARAKRQVIIKDVQFSDPCWDILLHLFVAHRKHKQVSVSGTCIAANVPPTTALRWITLMTDQGLINKIKDPTDSRRALLELSESVAHSMETYFRDIIDGGLMVI